MTVEIMRDDLSEIYYDDVEYVFGDSITAISPDSEVRFENAAPRRFDLVVGADGLHSDVRRLVFAEESRNHAFIGACFGVLTLPNIPGLGRELLIHVGVGRTAGLYGARHLGDAGYCPGPAVGGSTTLAVVGAYILAGEPARAGGDHERAFPAYERAMAERIRGSRAVALSAAKTLIPASRRGVWGLAQDARLNSVLPAGPGRALLRLTTKSARFYDSVTVDDYPPSD